MDVVAGVAVGLDDVELDVVTVVAGGGAGGVGRGGCGVRVSGGGGASACGSEEGPALPVVDDELCMGACQ